MEITLKNVRLSFPETALGAAKDYDDNKNYRHSATFIVEPGSENDKIIEAAILEEATKAFGKKAQTMIDNLRPQTNKFCYQKGDLKDFEGYAGNMYISAHRKQSDGNPLLLDNVKDPRTGKTRVLNGPDGKQVGGRIYGGCFVNAKISVYAQDGKNPGFRAGLVAIQFWKDGDSFGGARRADPEEFDSLDASEEEDLA
jgi:hypothetical protein